MRSQISKILFEVSSILYQFTGFVVFSIAIVFLAIVYTVAYFVAVFFMMFFGKIASVSLKEYLRPLYDCYKSIVGVFFGE